MTLSSSGSAILAVSIVFTLLAIIAVGLRTWARSITSVKFGWDDWLIVITIILCVAGTALNIYGVAVHALGEPLEAISPTSFIILEKVLYIGPCVLVPNLSLVKISILCFYKRIFITRKFHLAANIMIVICALWGVAVFLTQVFRRFPISQEWNVGSPSLVNYSAFLMAWASLDLVLDVIILCMPAFVIKSLNLRFKRKLLLIGVFGVGALCCIAESVRIFYQWEYLHQSITDEIDFNPVVTNLIIWSTIEPCVSVVAACLPILLPIFKDGRSPKGFLRNIRSFLTLESGNRTYVEKSHRTSQENESQSELRPAKRIVRNVRSMLSFKSGSQTEIHGRGSQDSRSPIGTGNADMV